jgi:ribose-phosphate pyrophosphokinase
MKFHWTIFPDRERHLQISESRSSATISSRLRDHDDLWKVSLMADALRGGGAKRITLIAPYLGYARQDRRVLPGSTAGGPLLLRQLAAAGVTRLVTADLHSERLRKHAPLTIVNADPWPLFAAALKKRLGDLPVTIVAPDKGAQKRARTVVEWMKPGKSVWIEKHRVSGARIDSGILHGQPKGETAVIVDDILSTGGTVEAAVKAIRKGGIRHIWVAVTHPVFAPGAARRLERLGIERLLVTDSLHRPKVHIPIETISILNLLKRAAR